ncbi:ABC transporter ATP-binding protein [Acetivibrio clariflavus]|uniref:ABC transporter ATP-binding protein n=1 Tax=Acetivibrio clariflavus TaxID=288965 RepID=UPI000484FAD0|nr:ABC transporter ATP-binding protein [Acetivibrio clariflavus]
METVVECRQLTKAYEKNVVLNQIDLVIKKEKIVGLLGPNGSGKTTLIKLINGLLVPTSGEILIGGKKPGLDTKKIVSYLPERNSLYNWMKVKELVEFYKEFFEDFSEEKANSLLSMLNIDSNSRLKILSKGTKEKIQLILAMSRDADLYCLDEPIGGVDPAAREHIINTILNNYNRKGSILISTHMIADIEGILDEVILIKEGNILEHSTTSDIKKNSGLTVDEYFRRKYKC